MNAERYAEVRRLFLQAEELEPEQRDAFLREACGDDEELRAEVEELLRGDDSRFLAPPSGSVLGAMLAGSEAELLDSVATPDRYRLTELLGKGGVGIVFKGRDLRLGRDIALKVLRRELQNDPAVRQRFVEEAQIGGQLQHPGVVPVYELGDGPDGLPFFSMKLIEGQTLAELLRRRKDAGSDRARLLGIFEQVCQTVAYAHARGVVHRDLKPLNIMVGAFGEVQVVDWGLAKVHGGEAGGNIHDAVETIRSSKSGSESLAGVVLGTPSYMPPEQARGRHAAIDPRTDVFALGAILCEILTGAPPHGRLTGKRGLATAKRGDPAAARARLQAANVDDELARITLHCLQPLREHRPSEAGEVAAAVGRYFTSVEDRARQAEVRAATARARIEEEQQIRHREVAKIATHAARVRDLAEKRIHRWQVAFAVAVVVGVGIILAGAIWLYDVRSDVSAQLDGQLRAAIERAERLETLAGNSLAPWQAARVAAASVERLSTSRAVDPALVQRGTEVRRRIAEASQQADQQAAQERRDREMLHNLEEVLLPRHVRLGAEHSAAVAADRRVSAYARIFRAHGVEWSMPPEDAAAKLATRFPEPVGAAFGHWLRALHGAAGGSPSRAEMLANQAVRLRDIAAAIDPDPWRRRMRRELALPEPTLVELQALRAAMPYDVQPATAVLLAAAFAEAGERAAAIDLLDDVRQRHAWDFGLNLQLGLLCEGGETPAPARAARYYTAALAARPALALVAVRLGSSLVLAGSLDDAERAYRTALRLDPDLLQAQHGLRWIAKVREQR